MRIGFSTTSIEPAYTKGQIDGIGCYTKNLLAELLKLKQDVIPYSFPKMNHCHQQPGIPNGKMFNVSFEVSTLCGLLSPTSFSVHQALEKDVAIFHATDHRIPRLKNIPVLATLNDAAILQHPEWSKKLSRKFKNSLLVKSAQWANKVITISKTMIPEIVEYWKVPEEKITVIYDGIGEQWFEEISSAEREKILTKLGIKPGFLLFTSTVHPKKNLPRIIQAYGLLPEDIQKAHPLIIVGKEGWNACESLAAISQLEARQAGKWLKYLPEQELRALYQSAAVYLCPSLHEGFGLTLLEAFASKTPAIASNVAAFPEISAGAALLVDPLSITEISSAILKLLTSPTLCSTYVEKGFTRARQFSWQKCAKETLAVYQSLL